MSWRGATYKLKRRGPRIDPWGTPKSTGRGLDVVFPMMIDCVRPLKGQLKYLLMPLLGKNQLAITLHMYASIGQNLDNTHRWQI